MRKAIVIGGNHHNTLGLVRGLGEAGVSSFVIIIGNPQDKNYVLKSKYIVQSAIVADEVELINLLLSVKKTESKQVLICTSDRAASIIDNNKIKLAPYYSMPGCQKEGMLTEYMEKEKMAEIARNVGLRTPKNWTVQRDSPVIENVTYPCIVKPAKSIDGSKMDIAICNNKTELQLHLRKCKAKDIRVEEFISKTVEYQLIGVALRGG